MWNGDQPMRNFLDFKAKITPALLPLIYVNGTEPIKLLRVGRRNDFLFGSDTRKVRGCGPKKTRGTGVRDMGRLMFDPNYNRIELAAYIVCICADDLKETQATLKLAYAMAPGLRVPEARNDPPARRRKARRRKAAKKR
jgi:hypothetical protein